MTGVNGRESWEGGVRWQLYYYQSTKCSSTARGSLPRRRPRMMRRRRLNRSFQWRDSFAVVSVFGCREVYSRD